MATELIINITSQEMRIAKLENGTLTDIQIERTKQRDLVGNIYKETPGVDIQNHPLHRGHVMVFCAKICEESDNRLAHQTPLEFGVRSPEFGVANIFLRFL